MTIQERKSTYFRPDRGSPLSPREVQIVEAMVSGLKPAQIAMSLNLSVKTVSTYRQRIMDKTGTVTDCQLGVIAEAVLQRTREYHSEVEAARVRLQAPKSDCDKCGGAGWLRGRELSNPSDDTYNDTMTKYPCDGEAHKQESGNG